MQICLVLLLLPVVVLLNCAGQTSCTGPGYNIHSLILGGDSPVIDYRAVPDNDPNRLIGTWISEKSIDQFFSQIRFDEQGNFQENIYRIGELQLLLSSGGKYQVAGNLLIFYSNDGNRHQFIYTLAENRLRLTAYSASREAANQTD